MRAHLAVLALVLSALTACSGGEGATSAEGASLSGQEVNEAWRADAVKALGTADLDLEALQSQAAVDCQRTDVANWIVTLGTSGDLTSAEATRVGLEHLCPEVEETFATAVKQIEDAADVNALVCAQPVAKLGSEEQMKVDFIC